MADESLVSLFKGIGLDDKKAAETAKNKDLSATLRDVIAEAGVTEIDKSAGSLLYSIATKYPAVALRHRPVLAKAIAAKEVTNSNLQACIDYLKKVGPADLNVEEFRSENGLGVVVSNEEIAKAVSDLLKEKHAELVEKRYRVNIGLYLLALRSSPATKWADGKLLNEELTKQIKDVLGPRTAEDDKPQEKKPEKKPETKEKAKEKPKEETKEEEESPAQETVRLADPSENIQQTPEILKAHLARTGGKVYTRFPPEPNGYLHIGHAKAMHVNFGYAKQKGGVCYLRFDDTNPEKEDMEYFNAIIEMVKWMGWEPWKITYSSHYFPKLYELAVELIKRDKAFVCHQTKEEMQASRRVEGQLEGNPSPYRNRPVEESLRLFEDMRKGKFAEGAAVLRMKGDMASPNPNMRDLVAYRIKYVPHPITGNDWCIYPSYDFTHCLIDSLEDITHSMCTLEFESRHESYDWLVDMLSLYRPVVWEYSRLNLTNTVLSKRKLIQLVKQGYVRGWDDPRMTTLVAFRRKGYTPEAINMFAEKIGVTRAPNLIPFSLLEQCCRLDLDPKAHRAMVVLRPLRVVLTNVPEDFREELTVPNHPKEDKGTHKVPLTRVVYIEKSDFKTQDEKGYYGLAPGKQVLLKYAHNITCTDVVTNDKNEVVEIKATLNKGDTTKLKGVLHWVAEGSPRVEIRQYDHLFKSENINELGADWLADLNTNSLEVIENAIADVSLNNCKDGEHFQFERQGFFVVDKDSTPEKKVFNRTVTLKESKSIQEIKKTPAPSASSSKNKKK